MGHQILKAETKDLEAEIKDLEAKSEALGKQVTKLTDEVIRLGVSFNDIYAFSFLKLTIWRQLNSIFSS